MLTPDQAISSLRWIRIQCDTELKKEIDRIVCLISDLGKKAKLGEAAEQRVKDAVANGVCEGKPNMSCQHMCNNHWICSRLRAEMKEREANA